MSYFWFLHLRNNRVSRFFFLNFSERIWCESIHKTKYFIIFRLQLSQGKFNNSFKTIKFEFELIICDIPSHWFGTILKLNFYFHRFFKPILNIFISPLKCRNVEVPFVLTKNVQRTCRTWNQSFIIFSYCLNGSNQF